MRRFSILFLVAMATTVAVHHEVLSLELGGRDLGRVADIRPQFTGGVESPGDVAERDISTLIYAAERFLLGASHRKYMMLGLFLVALVALTWGLVVREILRSVEDTPKILPLDNGLVAAILVASLGHHAEAASSVAGHVHLLAATTLGILVIIACRKPGLPSLAVYPLLGSLFFAETAGIVFLFIGPFAAIARQSVARVLLERRNILFLGILAMGRIAWTAWEGPLMGARDVGDNSTNLLEGLLRHIMMLLAPIPVEETGGLRHTMFTACFLSVPLVLGVLGHLWARKGMRPVALAGLAAMVVALLATLGGPTLPDSGADLRVLVFAGVAYAVFLTTCCDAIRGRSTQFEMIGLSFLVFFVGLSFLAGRNIIDRREVELFPAEFHGLQHDLQRIPDDYHEVVLLGTAADLPRAGLRTSLPALLSPPWSKVRPFELTVVPNGSYDLLQPELLHADKRTLICEWRPRSLFALGQRPANWTIGPLLGAELRRSSPIRLVSPKNDDSIVVRRPQRIEEDLTFVFETEPHLILEDDERFIFYGIYEGAFGPKGRGQLTARVLSPSVLSTTKLPNGGLRWMWRVSIRPGEGAEGVVFESPELGLGGRPFWWTMGVVQIPDHGDGEHHDHPAPLKSMPRIVAQTRRIRFVAAQPEPR